MENVDAKVDFNLNGKIFFSKFRIGIRRDSWLLVVVGDSTV